MLRRRQYHLLLPFLCCSINDMSSLSTVRHEFLKYVCLMFFVSWCPKILRTTVRWHQDTTKLAKKFRLAWTGIDPGTPRTMDAIVLQPFLICHLVDHATGMTHNRDGERKIKFISLFGDRGHRGPYSPFKPCNHNLWNNYLPSHR